VDGRRQTAARRLRALFTFIFIAICGGVAGSPAPNSSSGSGSRRIGS
jgi:hypothetical protein